MKQLFFFLLFISVGLSVFSQDKITHPLTKDQSLEDVADMYKVSIDSLKKWNKISGDVDVLAKKVLTVDVGVLNQEERKIYANDKAISALVKEIEANEAWLAKYKAGGKAKYDLLDPDDPEDFKEISVIAKARKKVTDSVEVVNNKVLVEIKSIERNQDAIRVSIGKRRAMEYSLNESPKPPVIKEKKVKAPKEKTEKEPKQKTVKDREVEPERKLPKQDKEKGVLLTDTDKKEKKIKEPKTPKVKIERPPKAKVEKEAKPAKVKEKERKDRDPKTKPASEQKEKVAKELKVKKPKVEKEVKDPKQKTPKEEKVVKVKTPKTDKPTKEIKAKTSKVVKEEKEKQNAKKIREPKPEKAQKLAKKKDAIDKDKLELLEFVEDSLFSADFDTKIDTNIAKSNRLQKKNERALAQIRKKNDGDHGMKEIAVDQVVIQRDKKKKKYKIGDDVDEVSREKSRFHLSRAKAEIDKQNFKKATEYINKSISLNPSYADAYILKGDLYASFGNYTEAINQYNNAIKLDKVDEQLYYNIGNCLTRLRQFDEAVIAMGMALDLNDKYVLAYSGRSALFMQQKKYEDAIADYTTMLKINKYFYPALKGRGVAYLENGDYDLAIIDFNQLLEYEPEDAFVYHQRGLAKLFDNKIYGGCLDLSSAVELGDADAERAIKKYCD